MNPFQSTIDSPFTDDDDQGMMVEEQEEQEEQEEEQEEEENGNHRTLAYRFSHDSVNAPSPRRSSRSTVAATSPTAQGRIKKRVPLARLAAYSDIVGTNPMTRGVLVEDVTSHRRAASAKRRTTPSTPTRSTSSRSTPTRSTPTRSPAMSTSSMISMLSLSSNEPFFSAASSVPSSPAPDPLRYHGNATTRTGQGRRRATNTEKKDELDELDKYCEAAKEGAIEMIQRMARARRSQSAIMLTRLVEHHKKTNWSNLEKLESEDGMYFLQTSYEESEKQLYHIQVLLKDMLELEKLEEDPLVALENTLSFVDRPGLKLSERLDGTDQSHRDENWDVSIFDYVGDRYRYLK